jgi:hypothetical protein
MEKAASPMGLKVNEEKTKCMVVTSKERRMRNVDKSLTTGEHNFEVVDEFKYVGTLINTENSIPEKIKRRIVAANRSSYGLNKIFKSKHLTWRTKIQLHKSLIRPVITYGSEAWVMNKSDEGAINIFERKILREIFGSIKEGDHWRRRYNNELYRLYGDQDLVSHIKVGRIRWQDMWPGWRIQTQPSKC